MAGVSLLGADMSRTNQPSTKVMKGRSRSESGLLLLGGRDSLAVEDVMPYESDAWFWASFRTLATQTPSESPPYALRKGEKGRADYFFNCMLKLSKVAATARWSWATAMLWSANARISRLRASESWFWRVRTKKLVVSPTRKRRSSLSS